MTVSDVVTGEVFRDLEGTGHEGINRVQWDLEGNEPEEGQGGGGFGFGGPQAPVAEAGLYRVTLTVDGRSFPSWSPCWRMCGWISRRSSRRCLPTGG